MMTKQEFGRLMKAIVEKARGMHKVGILDDAAYERGRARHPDRGAGTAQASLDVVHKG